MKTLNRLLSASFILGIFLLSLFAHADSDEDQNSQPQLQQQSTQDQQQQDPQQPQDQQQAQSQQQQPGAARISYLNGDVSTQRGDNSGWGGTTLNAPMAPGDQISTGDKSRAEVQLDYANVMRLSDNSEVKIADLSAKQIQVQIAHGLVDYSTFKSGEADIEIDTPNIAIRSLHPGNYRIQVNSDGETLVTVRHGEADITTPKGSVHLKQGELITVHGTDDPEYQITAASAPDDWDQWNKDRDRKMETAQSWQHTNHYYTGTQDLDSYGHWVNVPGYGMVWSPDAGADWAPYRDGSWVWEPYWGWTWVSYEPWGWAPYHYGRWFYYGSSWCWWPGPVYVGYRPLWAPAYVSFYGFGPHVGVGIGFGSVGWLAIGPFDAYRPWWGVGVGYRSVAVVDVVHGPGVIGPLGIRGRQPFYSNLQAAAYDAHVRAAVSSVRSDGFGGPVHAQAVDAATFRGGAVVSGGRLVPTSASLRPVAGGTVNNAAGAHAASNTRFFSVNHPANNTVPFNQQRSAVQSSASHMSANGSQGTSSWNRFSTNSSRPSLNLSKQIGTANSSTNSGRTSSNSSYSSHSGSSSSSHGSSSQSNSSHGSWHGSSGSSHSGGHDK